jgi:hypothetical protein
MKRLVLVSAGGVAAGAAAGRASSQAETNSGGDGRRFGRESDAHVDFLVSVGGCEMPLLSGVYVQKGGTAG